MLRLLILVFFMFAFAIAWRALRLLMQPPSAPRPRGQARMVKCAACDLYVPEAEALSDGERHYCSAAHRDAGPRGRSA